MVNLKYFASSWNINWSRWSFLEFSLPETTKKKRYKIEFNCLIMDGKEVNKTVLLAYFNEMKYFVFSKLLFGSCVRKICLLLTEKSCNLLSSYIAHVKKKHEGYLVKRHCTQTKERRAFEGRRASATFTDAHFAVSCAIAKNPFFPFPLNHRRTCCGKFVHSI